MSIATPPARLRADADATDAYEVRGAMNAWHSEWRSRQQPAHFSSQRVTSASTQTEYVAPALVVEYIAPDPVNVYVAPQLAATYATTALASLLEPLYESVVKVVQVLQVQDSQMQTIEKIVEFPEIPFCSRHPNFRAFENCSRPPREFCGYGGHGGGGVTFLTNRSMRS